jgi:fucose 4-O-acetylase-like acetyltransferase
VIPGPERLSGSERAAVKSRIARAAITVALVAFLVAVVVQHRTTLGLGVEIAIVLMISIAIGAVASFVRRWPAARERRAQWGRRALVVLVVVGIVIGQVAGTAIGSAPALVDLAISSVLVSAVVSIFWILPFRATGSAGGLEGGGDWPTNS